MEFTQQDLLKAFGAMRGYASGIPSDLSGFSSPAQLQRVIALKFQQDIEKGTGKASLDENGQPVTETSARLKLARTLRGAEPNLSGTQAETIEALTLAQLVTLNKNSELNAKDFSFFKLDSVISAEESAFIQEFAKSHELGTAPNMAGALARANEVITNRENAELEAKAEANDHRAINAGLRELGFQIDGPHSVEHALTEIMAAGHLGLQSTGRSAEYAEEKYGSAGLARQYRAIYDPNSVVIKDTAMAREVVGEALRGRNINFQDMLLSGDPAKIEHAKALAHAIHPDAGITVNSVLDQQTVDVAQAHMNTIGTAIPANYLSTDGQSINYAAVSHAAELGMLQTVPEEYLSADELADLNAFGGMNSVNGQQYLASLIGEKGAQWYAQGLSHDVEKQLAITVPKITPDALAVKEGETYSPEFLETVDVFDRLPASVTDGMPEDVEMLVTAKQNLIAAQAALGDPQNGVSRVGGIQSDGSFFDLAQTKNTLTVAENTYSKLEEEMRTDGGERWKGVQEYLLESEQTPAPATPDEKTPFQAPVVAENTYPTTGKPHDYVADRISSGFGVFARGESTPRQIAQTINPVNGKPDVAVSDRIETTFDSVNAEQSADLQKALSERTVQHMTAGLH